MIFPGKIPLIFTNVSHTMYRNYGKNVQIPEVLLLLHAAEILKPFCSFQSMQCSALFLFEKHIAKCQKFSTTSSSLPSDLPKCSFSQKGDTYTHTQNVDPRVR